MPEGSERRRRDLEKAALEDSVLNRKTATALGLTIPQSVLLRADQVIQ